MQINWLFRVKKKLGFLETSTCINNFFIVWVFFHIICGNFCISFNIFFLWNFVELFTFHLIFSSFELPLWFFLSLFYFNFFFISIFFLFFISCPPPNKIKKICTFFLFVSFISLIFVQHFSLSVDCVDTKTICWCCICCSDFSGSKQLQKTQKEKNKLLFVCTLWKKNK